MEKNQHDEKEIIGSFDLDIVKRLSKYLKPQLLKFLFCLVLILLMTGIDLSVPYLTKVAIDENITNYDEPMVVSEERLNDESTLVDGYFYTRESKVKISGNFEYSTLIEYQDDYYLAVGRIENYAKKDFELKNNQLIGPYKSFSVEKISEKEYQLFRSGDKADLIKIGLILLVLLLFNYIFSFINMITLHYASHKIIYELRSDLFEHVQKLSLSFFDKNPVGRLVTRVTNDMKNIAELFTTVLVTTLKDLFLIIGTIIVMLSINFELALVAFSTVPIVFIISYIFRIKARKIQRQVKKRLARINATLAENINGMSIIQIFNRENYIYKEFKKINEDYFQSSLNETKLFAIFKPSMNLIYSISLALIIWYGGGLSINQTIELGVLVAFIQYLNQFFRPIFDLAEKFNIFQSAMASSERVFMLLDEPIEIKNPKAGSKLPDQIKGRINFENVYFSYDTEENYILKDINFEVKPGETVALVGATGSGKTTITSLINRFYDIQKGRITIDGIDLKDIRKNDLREHIGMVLQDVFLFAGDIKSNIRLNNSEITLEEIKEVAKFVNAHEFISSLKNGYDQEVTERGSTLSTGQRQLLSFARALAFNPDVLILDEATSNIDTHTEILIQNAIEKLIQGRTTIIVAHRLSTIQNADKIIVLHNGKIMEMGTHNELIEKGKMYYDLYKLQYVD